MNRRHRAFERVRGGVAAANVMAGALRRRQVSVGTCPICVSLGRRGISLFIVTGESLRESTKCVRCRSNARNRALVAVLDQYAHGWRHGTVLELGAGNALTSALMRACAGHIPSQYLSDVPRGQRLGAMQSEDMEALTFESAIVEVVTSEDVLEHVLWPWRAVAEVARVLRPGGVHAFTVPYHSDWPASRPRIRVDDDGALEDLLPPEYTETRSIPGGRS